MIDLTRFGFAVDTVHQWLDAHGWDVCAYGPAVAIWTCPPFKRQAGDKSPFVLFDKRAPNEVIVFRETGEQVCCHNPGELLGELVCLYRRRRIGELHPAKMAEAISNYLLYGSASPRLLKQAKEQVAAAGADARRW
ncbi:hypothetical protein [Bradyrhizobium sp. Leo170]|uniref:hypothetical protein n=1 Tax=Bradyrhizobium sp. Leo170 TaxID=1571199 RepID=UPI00102EB626|nr:hypothetical protein [Bradyrhizobium sp. Leo170]